jgi:hypothetical protein
VSEALNTARKLKALEKAFVEHLYGNAKLRLLENRKLSLVSDPQEDLLAFQKRCRVTARREADKAYMAERLKYQPKFKALGLALPDHVPKQSAEDAGKGSSWLDWVWAPFRLAAAAPKTVVAVSRKSSKEQIKLESEWQGKVAALYEKWKQIGEDYSELLLTPRKVDVQVTLFGLAWAPFWQVTSAVGRIEMVPAYRSLS